MFKDYFVYEANITLYMYTHTCSHTMAKLFKSGQISESPSTTIHEKRAKIALDLVLTTEEKLEMLHQQITQIGRNSLVAGSDGQPVLLQRESHQLQPCTVQAHKRQG